MLENKTIGIVIPAYNEELLVSKVLTTMPDFVDTMIVVNDGSTDKTQKIVEQHMVNDKRIVLINHNPNQGLGQSLIDGYIMSRDMELDIVAIMAGDAQMDPDDLYDVVLPIIQNKADYVKGNRLLMDSVYDTMPKYRFIGNSILTLLTKFATGYWHIIDPQCGYTAISHQALKRIPIQKMTKGYGYNADILNMLNLGNFRVTDVNVKPVYGQEKSKIKLRSYIPKVSLLLFRLFHKRMFHKYLVREFNPLVFFYAFSMVCLWFVSLPLTIRFLIIWFDKGIAATTTLTILSLALMMGYFSFFFGMWLDMEDNKRLMNSYEKGKL